MERSDSLASIFCGRKKYVLKSIPDMFRGQFQYSAEISETSRKSTRNSVNMSKSRISPTWGSMATKSTLMAMYWSLGALVFGSMGGAVGLQPGERHDGSPTFSRPISPPVSPIYRRAVPTGSGTNGGPILPEGGGTGPGGGPIGDGSSNDPLGRCSTRISGPSTYNLCLNDGMVGLNLEGYVIPGRGGVGCDNLEWTVSPGDGAEVSSSGTNANLIFCQPGTFTVRVRGCDCVAGPLITVRVSGVDLDIDSDNNNGIEDPDRSCEEEQIENQGAGKVLFVAEGDSDGDGYPDWLDGMDFTTNKPSGALLVPLVLDIGPYAASADARITLQFDEAIANPLGEIMWGRLRIWTAGGNAVRGISPVTAGGNRVPSDEAMTVSELGISGGKVTLWVEAVNGISSVGGPSIGLTVSGIPDSCVTDTVVLTAAKIVAHDIQAWSPADGVEGGVLLNNADPYAFSSPVAGAITDGASCCLFRLEPRIEGVAPIRVKMSKAGSAYVDRAASFGTFFSAPIADESVHHACASSKL